MYNGGQLSQMTVGDQVLRFGYDASGAPLYVIWNASKYFYTTNLQGDVVAIVSVNGNPVVEYTYDAWGNILSITGSRADNLGKYNPLRYRGYVYDVETELYYLQSRYYNPEWGRFLNADVYVSTGQGLLGNNMFAYCLNNPVSCSDPSGTCAIGVSRGIGNQFAATYNCGCGGAGAIGVIAVPALFGLAEDAAKRIVAAVASLEATTQKRTHHVYVLTDPNADDIVKYVGRTIEPARRMVEHQNDPKHPERKNYRMKIIASGLTLEEARVVEQVLISVFTLGHLENARREIAIGRIDAYHQYIGAAAEIFVGATEEGLWALIGG